MKDFKSFQTQLALGEVTGIFDGVPTDVYHSLKNYASNSMLKQMKRSPAHARAYMDEQFEDSEALRMGRLIDLGVSDFAAFKAGVLVGPNNDKRTKEWKEFAAANAGAEILKPDEFSRVRSIAENIRKHPKAGPLLRASQVQQSIFWKDEATGVLCKCRPDFLTKDFLYSDLKSTEDASTESFSRSMLDYSYHMQVAFYIDGIAAVTGVYQDSGLLIAAEKSAPHAIVPYLLKADKEFGVDPIEEGRKMYRPLLERFAECQKSGIWPAYSDRIEPLSLPEFVNRKLKGKA